MSKLFLYLQLFWFLGLSPDTVEKDLRKHFTQFGQLVDVQVMRDKAAGVSRGFAFVTFACSFMAEAAMEHEKHVINDVEITPQFATQDIPRYILIFWKYYSLKKSKSFIKRLLDVKKFGGWLKTYNTSRLKQKSVYLCSLSRGWLRDF